jgi:hypothetical protein
MALPFMKKDGYFCSELIGFLFQDLNLFKKSKNFNPSNLLPKDFDGKQLEEMLTVTMSFEYEILFGTPEST